MSDVVLKDLLEFTQQETGIKKERALRDILYYSFVRQIGKGMR